MSALERIARESETPPMIIAEISANHGGSIDAMKEHISAAREAGADIVKIQTYTADMMTLDSETDDFLISHGKWKGSRLYDLYKDAETPLEWHEEIFLHAAKENIELFSTPFTEEAVDFLEKFDPPAYKVASFELTDLELVRHMCTKKRHLLMSTGMASANEVNNAINIAREHLDDNQVLLFHCISDYPAKLSDSNLRMIQILANQFQVSVGLSDHTIGYAAAIAATTLGARAIEKHFVIDRSVQTADSEFSATFQEMSELVDAVHDVTSALNGSPWKRSVNEEANKQFRRSLYYAKSMASGTRVDHTVVRKVRPGYGLPCEYLEEIIGKELIRPVRFGERVNWHDFKD